MSKINVIDDLNQLKRTVSMDNSPKSHHFIVLSYLYEWMATVAVPYARGRLLDYGCGGQTYRNLFQDSIDHYIGADVAAAPGIDLDVKIKVSQPLDVASESIDTVLSNQVLEHVPDPNFYLGEAARVLKSKGVLIITVPMQWRHHEAPFDFYRFTKYGLIELLKKNGFTVVKIDPCGGAFALIGQILCSYLSENGITYRGWIFQMLNRLFLWLDHKYPDVEESLAWMCIAKRIERNE
jgi:SAM-dependent methyltransferase